jgi:cyclase
MRRVRVIPTLLLNSDGGLVKTVKFGTRTYIGDPINAVKIFNDKGADELLLLDIDATSEKRPPNVALIEDIVSEAFMPVGYGGGINTLSQMKQLFCCGLEKVVLSTAAQEKPMLLREAADRFGSQSVVCCLDVRKNLIGKQVVYTHAGKQNRKVGALEAAQRAAQDGAGEILVYSVGRDGTMRGYDTPLLKSIATSVNVPVVACGGASSIEDFCLAIRDAKCSAVAAGSMFVYQGAERGILINYPSETQLRESLFSQI